MALQGRTLSREEREYVGTRVENDGQLQGRPSALETRRGDVPPKTYSPPQLLAWGSIRELTAGPIFGGQDDGFAGTGGT